MDTIASFTVDHLALMPGVYVSRRDVDPASKAVVTTFDLRLTAPNREPVMNTAEAHTIEHLGATFLRNHPIWASRVVYFGPMGCRTGFYLTVFGEVHSAEILPLVRELFEFVASFEGEIPGATAKECGNYLDQNLPMARWLAKRYLTRDIAPAEAGDQSRLHYEADGC
ncbi:S-ribosylhomocysteine lyase [Collinsella sp. AGMB00827]|uniref:S-ribosylhomocysteine lyase n=1 Tax=Collinsella ureilytica TaxID=2869515 RepID=A0ABS7MJ69_9ACTN|nr:S-ribosylhomocysteine lyase [Collinsella urealyticum]MBY4797302.1 S-ribosylhomocysteine lyase [Collinsella urealyticum]